MSKDPINVNISVKSISFIFMKYEKYMIYQNGSI